MRIMWSAFAGLAVAASAPASTLEWGSHPGHDWAPGDIGTHTYSVDGVDIDVTVADPSGITLSSPVVLPDDDNSFGISAFWIGGDFSGSESITVTLQFSVDVTDVSFSMYDIDGTGSDSESVIVGGSRNGGVIAMAGAMTGSGVDFDGIDTFSNNGSSNANPPAAIDSATVLGFASEIDTLTISFSANSAGKGFLIGDISFLPAPGAAAFLCLGGLAAARRRR